MLSWTTTSSFSFHNRAVGVEDGVGRSAAGGAIRKHRRRSQGAQVPHDARALVRAHLLRGLQVCDEKEEGWGGRGGRKKGKKKAGKRKAEKG